MGADEPAVPLAGGGMPAPGGVLIPEIGGPPGLVGGVVGGATGGPPGCVVVEPGAGVVAGLLVLPAVPVGAFAKPPAALPLAGGLTVAPPGPLGLPLSPAHAPSAASAKQATRNDDCDMGRRYFPRRIAR